MAPQLRYLNCALLIVWFGAGCPRAVAPPPSPAPAAQANDTVRAPADAELLEKMQNLCRLLTGPPLSVVEVAAQLGGVKLDYGHGSQVEVQVSDPTLEAADVSGVRDTGIASVIDLRFRAPIWIPVLKATFGEYREKRQQHWDSPIRISFSLDMGAQAKACHISATVEPEVAPIRLGHVRTLAIFPG